MSIPGVPSNSSTRDLDLGLEGVAYLGVAVVGVGRPHTIESQAIAADGVVDTV